MRVALVAICGTLSTAALANEVTIPGTSVALDASAGFTLSSAFSGLANTRDGSSITINELPLPGYSDILSVYSDFDTVKAAFAQQGITIDSADTNTIENKSVPILIGRQSVPNGHIGKYMALFRGDSTVLLTVNEIDPDIIPQASIERTIKSVKILPAAGLQEKLDQLPFTVQAFEPFYLADVIGGSTALLQSFEGTGPAGSQPIIVVARALGNVTPANAQVIAEQVPAARI